MTKRKYLFDIKQMRNLGIPKEDWPLNNGYPKKKNAEIRPVASGQSIHYTTSVYNPQNKK